MIKNIFTISLILLITACSTTNERAFQFRYQVELEQTKGKIELWIPVPQSNEVQTISNINYDVTWQNSGRVHSEFEWYTIKTENFNVHYHKDIESIAIAGANIAEQVLPILLKQIELDSIPLIDIILTTEDEIMNG